MSNVPPIVQSAARLLELRRAATQREWCSEGPPENIHLVEAARPHMRICFMTSDGLAEENAAFITFAANHAEDLATAVVRMEALLRRIHSHMQDRAWRTLIEEVLTPPSPPPAQTGEKRNG